MAEEHHSAWRTTGILVLLAVLIVYAFARFPEVRADFEKVAHFHRGHLPPSEPSDKALLPQPGNKHLRVLRPQPDTGPAPAPAPTTPGAEVPTAPATTAPAAD